MARKQVREYGCSIICRKGQLLERICQVNQTTAWPETAGAIVAKAEKTDWRVHGNTYA